MQNVILNIKKMEKKKLDLSECDADKVFVRAVFSENTFFHARAAVA